MSRDDRDLFAPRRPRARAHRTAGEIARDAGCELVLANERSAFQTEGLAVIGTLVTTGQEFSMDAIRKRVTTRPHHPNAWGALMRVAHQLRLIRRVGRKRSERDPAHAREIPIYRGMPE